MADSNPFNPPPNTPVAANPKDDAYWQRWFWQIWKRIKEGALGGTVTSVGLSLPSSTFTVSGSPVTTSGTLSGAYKTQTANTVFAGPTIGSAAVPTFRALVPADIPSATPLTVGTTPIVNGTVGRVLYEGASNILAEDSDLSFDGTTLTTGGLNNTGNTTLGDASGDSLTINAGNWTIGSNYTATRTAGTVAAGLINALNESFTYSGDSGGTSNVRPWVFTATPSGSANLAETRCLTFNANNSSTGTTTLTQACSGTINNLSSGATTTALCFSGAIVLTGSGNVTSGSAFFANPVAALSSGVMTTYVGFDAGAIGGSAVGISIAFRAVDQSGSTSAMQGFRSQLSSGPGKLNFYASGSADNIFAGNVRVGGGTVPSVALDVTGAVLISSTLGVTGALSANTIQVLTGTTATVYNTAATTVNAFGGASVALNIGNSGGTNTVSGATTFNQAATFGSTARLKGFTVGTLPAAGTAGRMAYVTDALAPTFLGVVVGGGAVVTPVFDNGTAWVSF